MLRAVRYTSFKGRLLKHLKNKLNSTTAGWVSFTVTTSCGKFLTSGQLKGCLLPCWTLTNDKTLTTSHVSPWPTVSKIWLVLWISFYRDNWVAAFISMCCIPLFQELTDIARSLLCLNKASKRSYVLLEIYTYTYYQMIILRIPRLQLNLGLQRSLRNRSHTLPKCLHWDLVVAFCRYNKYSDITE
jgi:hypothetical protein